MIRRKGPDSVEMQHDVGLHLHGSAARTTMERPSSDGVKRVLVKIDKPGAALKMRIYHLSRFQYLKGDYS